MDYLKFEGLKQKVRSLVDKVYSREWFASSHYSFSSDLVSPFMKAGCGKTARPV